MNTLGGVRDGVWVKGPEIGESGELALNRSEDHLVYCTIYSTTGLRPDSFSVLLAAAILLPGTLLTD